MPYDRKLAALARVPLLIVDDFGLKPLRPPADEDLHDLIAERYETAATIVMKHRGGCPPIYGARAQLTTRGL